MSTVEPTYSDHLSEIAPLQRCSLKTALLELQKDKLSCKSKLWTKMLRGTAWWKLQRRSRVALLLIANNAFRSQSARSYWLSQRQRLPRFLGNSEQVLWEHGGVGATIAKHAGICYRLSSSALNVEITTFTTGKYCYLHKFLDKLNFFFLESSSCW